LVIKDALAGAGVVEVDSKSVSAENKGSVLSIIVLIGKSCIQRESSVPILSSKPRDNCSLGLFAYLFFES